jgi:tetratricopeptide (TPR) repeat protein
MHTKAQLLLQLGRPEAAEALFRKLLSLNPDDYRVHEGLHLCLGIKPPSNGQSWQQQQQAAAADASSSEAAPSSSSSSSSAAVWSPHSGKKRRLLQVYSEEERSKLVALYEALGQQYPKSMACQRIPLDFLVSGVGFKVQWFRVSCKGLWVWSSKLVALYEALGQQYPKSMACQCIPLDFLVSGGGTWVWGFGFAAGLRILA